LRPGRSYLEPEPRMRQRQQRAPHEPNASDSHAPDSTPISALGRGSRRHAKPAP
jgi:hypothetical protein